MRRVAIAVFVAVIGAPALASAPPPAPVPYSWTGFYFGAEFGAGWSGGHGVNFSPNDSGTASLFNGTAAFSGEQPLASSQGLSQSGAVGGFEVGYNWQAGSNWVVGLEADFSFSGISGQASGPTSVLAGITPPITQSTNAKQSTDWYGTVRGRAGLLATPDLLLFGTGGFAYGRVSDSANYLESSGVTVVSVPIVFVCTANVACLAGSSSAIRTGFTAGGGAEWRLDQRWSAKIEYQFVDLGTETVRVTALAPGVASPTASFNAAFHDQFHVVRVGLNYRY